MTLLSPKWAEIFVAQMAGDETSLPLLDDYDVEKWAFYRFIRYVTANFLVERSEAFCHDLYSNLKELIALSDFPLKKSQSYALFFFEALYSEAH